MRPHILLLALPSANAFQLPFNFPLLFKSTPAVLASVEVEVEVEPQIPLTPRVAIIGAGAGGSSAAFWIGKAKERFGLDVEIDVYEKEGYIGGRSTIVYPHDNKTLSPLELGASIFVQANKNMMRAAEEFNFDLNAFEDEGNSIGIWDGQKIRFTYNGGWWDTGKLLWRYGYKAPSRTQAIVQNVVSQFVNLYNQEPPRWDNISILSREMGWTSLTEKTMGEYFAEEGLYAPWINEFVEGSTRVNYGQNVDELHALVGLCSQATDGAVGVAGGNFQIFEKFLKTSGANVKLNTVVKSITPAQSPSDTDQWTVITNDDTSTNYQAVIISAPIHQTSIALPDSIIAQVPLQPYVHLHVTLLTTTSPVFNPTYFGLGATDIGDLPGMMLTTNQGVREGGKEPEFNSISYHGKVQEGEWAVKIFSKEEISDEWLDKMFNGTVTWVHRKLWQSYPYLPPTTTFPPVHLAKGLYYVNSFEPFISTMETETISARNIVDLLLKEEFDSGICHSHRVPLPGPPSEPAPGDGEDEQPAAVSEDTEQTEEQQQQQQQPLSAPVPASAEPDEETQQNSSSLESSIVRVQKEFVYGWDC